MRTTLTRPQMLTVVAGLPAVDGFGYGAWSSLMASSDDSPAPVIPFPGLGMRFPPVLAAIGDEEPDGEVCDGIAILIPDDDGDAGREETGDLGDRLTLTAYGMSVSSSPLAATALASGALRVSLLRPHVRSSCMAFISGGPNSLAPITNPLANELSASELMSTICSHSTLSYSSSPGLEGSPMHQVTYKCIINIYIAYIFIYKYVQGIYKECVVKSSEGGAGNK
jgi:hypothetical protein